MSDDERHDLYVQYYDRVVGYLVREFHFSDEEARDIAQDAFLSVFVHMRQKAIAAPWLFIKTTAHNRAVNVIRSRIRHRRTDAGSSDAMPHISELFLHDFWTNQPPPSPETEAGRSEEAALLRDRIEHLPETFRPCVLLRMDGLSYDEIARALGITPNAVKTRLRDAKKRLVDGRDGIDDGTED